MFQALASNDEKHGRSLSRNSAYRSTIPSGEDTPTSSHKGSNQGTPEVQFHARVLQDEIIRDKGGHSPQTEQIAVECGRVVDIKRQKDRQPLDAVGVSRGDRD
ncbi:MULTISPECIES: hypothetical protein [Rhizobium]|uniref:hypothetical protein n=1 Tax=Rhizobium TaxID=379 RepID=UPI001293D14F|nr:MULTISPECIES: hypothetical protein [Rhizobium]